MYKEIRETKVLNDLQQHANKLSLGSIRMRRVSLVEHARDGIHSQRRREEEEEEEKEENRNPFQEGAPALLYLYMTLCLLVCPSTSPLVGQLVGLLDSWFVSPLVYKTVRL